MSGARGRRERADARPAGGRRRIRGRSRSTDSATSTCARSPRARRRAQRRAGRRSPRTSRPTRSCTAPDSRIGPIWWHGWPTGASCSGRRPSCWRRCAIPGRWAAAARSAGARAPETATGARRAPQARSRAGGCASRGDGGGGRGVRRWTGGALRPDRDPPAPRRRAVLLGGRDRRRPARRRPRAHRAAASPAGLSSGRATWRLRACPRRS